jgi:hypothetical protein
VLPSLFSARRIVEVELKFEIEVPPHYLSHSGYSGLYYAFLYWFSPRLRASVVDVAFDFPMSAMSRDDGVLGDISILPEFSKNATQRKWRHSRLSRPFRYLYVLSAIFCAHLSQNYFSITANHFDRCYLQ